MVSGSPRVNVYHRHGRNIPGHGQYYPVMDVIYPAIVQKTGENHVYFAFIPFPFIEKIAHKCFLWKRKIPLRKQSRLRLLRKEHDNIIRSFLRNKKDLTKQLDLLNRGGRNRTHLWSFGDSYSTDELCP